MRRQNGPLLPSQASRPGGDGARAAALRYASWGWPVTTGPHRTPTTDLGQVYTAWTRLPDAPVLAPCAVAFDVIAAAGPAGYAALARLERLGVDLGPVAARREPRGRWNGAADGAGREPLAFLVRAGSARTLEPVWAGDADSRLLDPGELFELPALGGRGGRVWLREPTARPVLPAAHVVVGALALAPYRALAAR
jgi:hypothetical protein